VCDICENSHEISKIVKARLSQIVLSTIWKRSPIGKEGRPSGHYRFHRQHLFAHPQILYRHCLTDPSLITWSSTKPPGRIHYGCYKGTVIRRFPSPRFWAVIILLIICHMFWALVE
jgi:hypothetical protein